MQLLKNLIALPLIGVLISGCATSGCGGFRYIHPSRHDVLTDGTAKQILENNEYGERQNCPANPGTAPQTPLERLKSAFQ